MLVFARRVLLVIADAGDVASELVTLHLFKNDYLPTPDSILSDFTEADFDGYASQTLTLRPAYLNVYNIAQLDSDEVVFVCNSDASPNTIFGVFILNSHGELVASERFPAVVPMSVANAMLRYTLHVTVAPS